MRALLAGAPSFAADLWTRRRTIVQLGIDDFRKQYIGSALGILWAVLKPAVHVLSLWLIFSVGFRQGRNGTYPFVLYILSGTCVWQFVSEALAKGTQAVTENSHLVKKVVFPLEFLPVVRLLSSLLFHLVFLGLVAVVSILSGHPPGVSILQLPYYLPCRRRAASRNRLGDLGAPGLREGRRRDRPDPAADGLLADPGLLGHPETFPRPSPFS